MKVLDKIIMKTSKICSVLTSAVIVYTRASVEYADGIAPRSIAGTVT